jgi:hypothetical protein
VDYASDDGRVISVNGSALSVRITQIMKEQERKSK